MTVASPPRPPRRNVVVDRDELRALVEALIEEARQRARRRRRRRAACILLALLGGGALYLGLDRGGSSTGATQGEPPSNSAATAVRSAERWGASRGPDGGPVYSLAVAPSAPQDVYAGTSRGVFRSTDGGKRWTTMGLARKLAVARSPFDVPGVTSLVVDPRAPATLYAGLNGWCGGVMSYREAVYKSSDGGRIWRPLALRGQPVAVGPATAPTVYATTDCKQGAARLVRSSDGGRTWHPADAGLPSTFPQGLAFDPSNPETLYAAMGERGLFESTNGGARWHPIAVSARYGEVTAVAVDPSGPRTVYAGTNVGLVVSRDAGRSWRMLNATLGAHGRDRGYGRVTSLLVDPRDSNVLFATTTCTGVFRSTDGGHSWAAANPGVAPHCSFTDLLALDPRASETLYTADNTHGVFTSSDRGAHWQAANQGLSLTSISSVAADARRSRTVYAGTRALGLFESTDGGARWRRVGRERVAGIAIDPISPGTVLVASPPNGIVRSSDAGRTWTWALGGRSVSAVAIRGTRAYAGVPDGGTLFGSTDAGRTWHGLGRLGGYLEALAIEPRAHGAVYAAVADSGSSPAGGLYRSTDDGHTWQRLTDAEVTTVAPDPRKRETVYAGTSEGVLRSTDGGATWQGNARLGPVRTRGVGVTALAVDPVDPMTLYVAIGRSGVFGSTDAGRSWHSVDAGLSDARITSLAFDATGRTLYAGTASGGVVSLRR